MSRQRMPRVLYLVAVLLPSFASPHAWSQDAVGDAADINIHYFQANLDLAKHDMEVALRSNRRIPNMISKLTMIRLQNQVKYTTKLLEQAMTKDVDDLHMAHLQSVENDLALAERQLKWAEERRQKLSGAVRDDDLKRLRLSAELARLALQRAKSPQITADPMNHVQWQLDRLRLEVLGLQVAFERIRSGH